jgi:hypothetical protein
MTNSTRWIGLIMTALLWSGIATAQGLPAYDSGEDLPPDLALPLSNGASMAPADMQQPTTVPSGPTREMPAAESVDGYYSGQDGDAYRPDLNGLWAQLAPIESTGTWLRRGFWYAETDAVIFNRMWSRRDKRFAVEDSHVTQGPTFVTNPVTGEIVQSLGFNQLLIDSNRILMLNGALPGEDASVRGTLGTFLFRDAHNRDHTLEFTVLGSGNWDQNRTMSSVADHGLFVPFQIAGNNRTFDRSSRQEIDYTSNVDSFEMNYHVRARLGHDQLIMDPNGCWHRAANAGFEREYLIGLRILQLQEKLDWRAQDIVNVGADGSYLIHTDNDLFGFQLGTGMTYQAPRWSLGATAKGGVFLNDALGRSQLNFTADDTDDADLRLRENQLSFVGEFRLLGRYHVLPNVSVRAGYEMMLITSAALAPPQSTFVTDTTYLNTTGNPFYHGASFGFEWYW